MVRLSRMVITGTVLGLLAACGGLPAETTARESPSREPETLTLAAAETAFADLAVLETAWGDSDCDEVARLLAAPIAELGGAACTATALGHEGARFEYGEPEFYLPSRDAKGRPWFAALAKKPDPAYFVFTQGKGGWRLALGPIPVPDGAPEVPVTEAVVPAGDVNPQVTASLVSQRCLTYLTDPTGVNGIRVSSGDALRELRDSITRAPARHRPDKIGVDVRLVRSAPAHALALPGGASLVFHTLRLVTTQSPGPGRDSLAKPSFPDRDVRAFAGQGRLGKVTAEELLFLATKVDADGRMTTVGLGRRLASVTNG
ncbi:hypothetical protein [Herbidospora sp. NBRC 101105]|uniref:hypothetical protein n=1 Tax=Herbidospora sp. NBRC 101105 TaxID=3032195 RepID=UPI0024A15BD6|nr:hypothetical protein [Herbidospora sp. NBRC 101105]GLX95544.1 hypothetical protein Hesp01_34940 [Herbidospora sp. NBRC 101105]